MKKIQCQERPSLIAPPMIGPSAGPVRVVIAQMPMAIGRFSGGKTRISSVCETGISGAPHKP
jgi:hypothetical protein